MSTVNGVLTEARTNPSGFCSILVDGVWYGTYKTDHSDLQGKAVSFDAETVDRNGRQFHNAKDVKELPASQQKAVQKASRVSNDDRQRSIVFQSSLKVATQLVCALIAADKVALGAKAKAMDTAAGLVEELTVRFFSDAIDPDQFLANMGLDEGSEAEAAEEYDPMEA